ncbi:hypothetical protein M378DRAFT_167862 [Amanita muscaria Koide BX008]|uniref:Uncharacterized protein n=1 Tax=Amanita muscaria (strain Koide BX008) TaxID=946122 RepID=A0A0C2WGR0_AMAMK|nr:hypothetical protein M378DRAFT_167862 [Amanita muscaria Koide BX008]
MSLTAVRAALLHYSKLQPIERTFNRQVFFTSHFFILNPSQVSPQPQSDVLSRLAIRRDLEPLLDLTTGSNGLDLRCSNNDSRKVDIHCQ